jgi:hypothetical protein
MSALLTAVGFILFAFAVQVVVWRVGPPRNHLRALLAIFVLSAAAGIILLVVTGVFFHRPLLPLSQVPGVALCDLGAIACYLVIYTGVEDASPSLILLRTLEAAGDRGCRREELAALFTEDRLVRPRLDGLKRDSFVVASGAGYALTPRGLRMARTAALLARIFRIHESA